MKDLVMSTAVRIGGFVAAVVIAFAVAFGAGYAVGPDVEAADNAPHVSQASQSAHTDVYQPTATEVSHE